MILPASAFLLLFLVIIFTNLLGFSFTFYKGINETFPSINNYATLINSNDFRQATLRTLIYVLVSTPLQLIFGLCMAFLINRDFKCKGAVKSTFLISMSVPGVVTSAIFLMLFSFPYGHINDILTGRFSWFPKLLSAPIKWQGSAVASLGVSLMADAWKDIPISMLILLAGLQMINKDQYEAAETMGANAFNKLVYITIPLLMPSISSVLILRSIEAWKSYLFPFTISPSYPLVSVLIDVFYHSQRNPGLAATAAIFLIIFIFIFSMILNFLLKKINSYLIKA